MISIIAGGILFICSAYVGIMIKRHYKKRRDFFKDLIALIDMLNNEISYLKTPLKKIIEQFSDGKKGELKEFLKVYYRMIAEGEALRFQQLEQAYNLSFLKKDEKETVIGFFSILGKTDATTQIYNLKNYRLKFADYLQTAEKELSTSGNLAYKLGVLLGVAVMIIVA